MRSLNTKKNTQLGPRNDCLSVCSLFLLDVCKPWIWWCYLYLFYQDTPVIFSEFYKHIWWCLAVCFLFLCNTYFFCNICLINTLKNKNVCLTDHSTNCPSHPQDSYQCTGKVWGRVSGEVLLWNFLQIFSFVLAYIVVIVPWNNKVLEIWLAFGIKELNF